MTNVRPERCAGHSTGHRHAAAGEVTGGSSVMGSGSRGPAPGRVVLGGGDMGNQAFEGEEGRRERRGRGEGRCLGQASPPAEPRPPALPAFGEQLLGGVARFRMNLHGMAAVSPVGAGQWEATVTQHLAGVLHPQHWLWASPPGGAAGAAGAWLAPRGRGRGRGRGVAVAVAVARRICPS